MRSGEIGKRQAAGLAPQAPETAAEAPAGRALVALSPAAALSEPSAQYRQAPFLAQLIATREQLPQTRERRRAAPHEAAAAYRAAAALTRQR